MTATATDWQVILSVFGIAGPLCPIGTSRHHARFSRNPGEQLTSALPAGGRCRHRCCSCHRCRLGARTGGRRCRRRGSRRCQHWSWRDPLQSRSKLPVIGQRPLMCHRCPGARRSRPPRRHPCGRRQIHDWRRPSCWRCRPLSCAGRRPAATCDRRGVRPCRHMRASWHCGGRRGSLLRPRRRPRVCELLH